MWSHLLRRLETICERERWRKGELGKVEKAATDFVPSLPGTSRASCLRLLADRQIVGGRGARPSRPGRPRRPSRLAPPPTTQGSRRDRLLWVQLEKNVSRLKTEMDQGVVHHEPTSSEPHPDVKVLELIVIAINGSL